MSQEYDPPAAATSHPDRLTRGLLLAVWLALTAAALGFVYTFGANLPYADEWEFVPALNGHEAIGPWLWMQHNEHRLPLPRALYLGLFRLTHDFRSGMYLQIVLLAALALALMRVAARLRGRAHWADAFFPIALLHIGNWENFLMGYQVCFALFTVLVMSIGVVALRTTQQNATASGVKAGVLALLLSLCGGFGIVVALPVCCWLAYLAARGRHAAPHGRTTLLCVLAVLPLLYLALYRTGYERPPFHPEPGAGGPRIIAITTSETLAMAFGIGAEIVWPWAAAGVVILCGYSLVLLRRAPNRVSSLGLFAVALGVAGLALAIGVGRSGFTDQQGRFFEDMGLWSRYTLLTWPLLGLAYLVCVQHGQKWVPIGLCLAAALIFQLNMQVGLRDGESLRQRHEAIAVDAQQGWPAEWIVARNLVGTGQEARAIRGIPMLREAKIGVFAGN